MDFDDLDQQSAHFRNSRPHLGARVADALYLLNSCGIVPTSVLDVGSGAGRLSVELARQFQQVHTLGVDTDEAAVIYATELASAEGLSNRCRFIQGDVRQLVQGSADFDLVCILAGGGIFRDSSEMQSATSSLVSGSGHLLIDDAVNVKQDDLTSSSIGSACSAVVRAGARIIASLDRLRPRDIGAEMRYLADLEAESKDIADINQRDVEEVRRTHSKIRAELEGTVNRSWARTRLWLLQMP